MACESSPFPTRSDLLAFVLITLIMFFFIDFAPLSLAVCRVFSLDFGLGGVEWHIAAIVDDRWLIFSCATTGYALSQCWRTLSREQRRMVIYMQIIAGGVVLASLSGTCDLASIIGLRPSMMIAFLAAVAGLAIGAAFSRPTRHWLDT